MAEGFQSEIMKNLHSSINAVANILFSLLLFVSLGTSAIVTQQSLPVTRVVDVAPGLITPAPEVDYQAIFARGNVATCGYVSGKAGKHCHFDSSGLILTWKCLSLSPNMPSVLHVYFDYG